MSAKAHSFVAIYSGESISTARLICASADKTLVSWVAQCLLRDEAQGGEEDAHVEAVREGRRKALSLILNTGN